MLPESVKIGCFEYAVVETDEPIIVNKEECSGAIDFRNHIISIKQSGISEQLKEETLWHEIVHGIFDYRQIETNKKIDEETLVDSLALSLYGLMQDNEWLPGMRKAGD